MSTVYKEEGLKKLMLGGIHPRFMFNTFNGLMFLFIYDQFLAAVNRQNPMMHQQSGLL